MTEGIAKLEQSLQHARHAPWADESFWSYHNLALYLANVGQFQRAEYLAAEGVCCAIQVGWEDWQNRLRGLLAWISLRLGQWAQAHQHLEHIWQSRSRGIELLPALIKTVYITQSQLLLSQGKPDAAQDIVRKMFDAYPAGQNEANVLWLQAQIALAKGELMQANDYAAEGIRQATDDPAIKPQLIWSGQQLLACLDIFLRNGEYKRAVQVLTLLSKHHQKLVTPLTQAVVTEAQGLIVTAHDPTEAATHFQQAAMYWRAMRLPLEEAVSRRRRATCLLRTELKLLHEEANQELQAAMEIATYLGVSLEQTAIAAVPQQRGVTAQDERRHLKRLTRREQEVLHLIVQGLSNRAIATALSIAEKTAETHVRNILSKLECASRTQVVAQALQHGRHAPSFPH